MTNLICIIGLLVVFFGAIYYVKNSSTQKISLVVEFIFLLFFFKIATNKTYVIFFNCADGIRILSMVLMFVLLLYGIVATYKRSKSEYDKQI